jgi:5-hydroxyisourate hydrolase-like protein (transthyretin family)
MRAVAWLTLFLSCTATTVVAHQRDQPLTKPGTGTLRGRVFGADTGQPLRRAQVQLNPETAPPGAPSESQATTTDADGRYEFKGLRAGRYTVRAQKSSYLAISWGQQRSGEPGKLIGIVDGQTIDRVDFALPKGGAITGRVLDEFGEPAAEVQVAVMRVQSIGGARRLLPVGRMVSTNDIGEFRLSALPPGGYYVSATLRTSNAPNVGDDRSGYASTYFPGTSDLSAAEKIAVGPGQTISEITIPLLPIRTARITGLATDSFGRPLQGIVAANRRLSSGTTLGMVLPSMLSPWEIRPDGSFMISGLAPGDYTLQFQGPSVNGPDGEYASLDVSVYGTDVTGISLVSSKPPTLTGRVVLSAANLEMLRPAGIRVSWAPFVIGGTVMTMGSGPHPTAIADDWSFQIRVRPGMTRLNVHGLQPPWTVKSVRYRGSDVTDTGLEVRVGEDLNDVEVELTSKTTTLTGTVTNLPTEAMPDYWAVVFPQDRDKRVPPSRYVRSARPDQDGRFTITMLPPGDYLAFAAAGPDTGEATEPEFLDRIERRATRVSLTEGETRRIDLKLSSIP